MSWPIWFRKLGLNILLAVLTAVIAAVSGLQTQTNSPYWLLLALPLILVGIKALENFVKHIKT